MGRRLSVLLQDRAIGPHRQRDPGAPAYLSELDRTLALARRGVGPTAARATAVSRPDRCSSLFRRLSLRGIAQRVMVAFRRHFEMPLMQRYQGRAVADGDDRGVRQAPRQRRVEFRFKLLLNGGCGLVEQQPVWAHQQGTRDREPLLLAAG